MTALTALQMDIDSTYSDFTVSSLSGVMPVHQNLFSSLALIPDGEIKRAVTRTLRDIACAGTIKKHQGEDLSFIPPLTVSRWEDGSVVVGWSGLELRVGVSIEEEPKEYGWYITSTKLHSNFSKVGSFPPDDVGIRQAILQWLLDFLVHSS